MTSHPWSYLADACEPGFAGEKPTYIENLFDMPGYLDKLRQLTGIVPNALDDKELCQAFNDLMLFGVTIQNFIEDDMVADYTTELAELVATLVAQIKEQYDAMHALVLDRGLMDVITHSDWPACAWMPEGC